jgi:trimethylamine--corrinoid protein Co-methyltransferase
MLRHRYDLLSASAIEQIHQTSVRLLDQVGVVCPHEDALAIFEKHGVRVDGNRVCLSEDQVMTCVGTVPRQFTVHARNPDRDTLIGGVGPVFAPAYGAPFLVDAKVGKRPATMADYQQLAKLAHMLPNQNVSGHLLVQPGDLPADTAYLRMLQAHMVHSDKPFLGSADGSSAARHTMQMASIVFERDVRDWPVTLALINSQSPLGFGRQMLGALIEYAHWRQPVIVAAMAMAGMTGPGTLAGVLAMQNAELLTGITLAQLVAPGTPVLYGTMSSTVDMRTGALVIGSPELSLLIAAHAQLARFYGLPSRGGGALTDASSPDAQAGFESMFSLLTAVNSDIDLIIHAAGILGSFLAFSYEKLVLDDEMCGMVRRFRRGIIVDGETLAYDVIAKVGPGGNFLSEDDTLDRCRTEYWHPAFGDRGGVEAWMADGRRDALARASDRCQRLLEAHEDPPLDPTTLRRLAAFVAEHAR